MDLNENYWQNRYQNSQSDWDVGYVATPLKTYFDQLKDKSLKILIPGGGNSYEAEYLHQNGFTNVFVIDLVEEPLKNFQKRNPEFPSENLIHGNFFDYQGQFNLIVEQTFFCALDPALRPNYARKMNELLVTSGKLTGVLFNCEFEGGPPFGGSKAEYLTYFEPFFKIKTCEACYNSIKPRTDREFFIILEKE